MTTEMSNVVQLRLLKPRAKSQSQYNQYLLPFFDKRRRRMWAVKPTGNYLDDCKMGRRYAIEFLQTCDGTHGWISLLGPIVGGMIHAGCETWPGGGPKNNGVVIGFMGVIAKAAALGTTIIAPAELVD